VRIAARDWGVVADGASQWLPSRSPVALLAGCLLLRVQPRTYSMVDPSASSLLHPSTLPPTSPPMPIG
jgi:hypothetical protein